MRTILIIFFTLLAIHLTFAGEDNGNVEIKGAFGYSLGGDASNISGEKSKVLEIEVPAKIPFRNFTRCSLALTDDKKIYYISI